MVRRGFCREFNVNTAARPLVPAFLLWTFPLTFNKVIHKSQYDIVFRCTTHINIELSTDPTDHDVRFSLIPEFNDFDFLFCCEHHFSYKLELHIYQIS